MKSEQGAHLEIRNIIHLYIIDNVDSAATATLREGQVIEWRPNSTNRQGSQRNWILLAYAN